MKNAVCILVILAAVPCRARIITVDDDAPADFTTIQAAIDDANDGDTVEIQPGTYTGDGNRDIDFLGKAITVTSTNPNDPNTVAETIIADGGFDFESGEEANSILDGLTITRGGVSCSGTAPTVRNCTIDGGGIGCGDASSPRIRNCTISNCYSHAIYCQDGSSPTIINCVFTSNGEFTTGGGGAICCMGNSSAVISDCLFAENWAGDGGAIYCRDGTLTISRCDFQNNLATNIIGGAIRARGSNVTIVDSTFEYNWAEGGAGALYCSRTSTELTVNNCLFIGNSTNGIAGGLACAGSTTLTNCIFAGNSAWSEGGGLCVGLATDLTIANCTFVGNYAGMGDSLYGFATSTIFIRDSIVWDGPDSIVIGDETNLLVTFCDTPGTVPGYGNIDADPCFVDPGRWVDSRDPNIVVEPNDPYASWVHGDYHVKSQGGRYDPNTQSWVRDDVTSPCIDAGDPNSPIGPEPFSSGGLRNIGVYGGTAEASKSYFGRPACETIVAGDINGDCIVNGLDFSLMGAHWLGRYHKTYPTPATDPYPANGESAVSTRPALMWSPGLNAVSHDVYFGSDHTAIGYADRDSPEYKGNQTDTTFYAPDLLIGTAYYWRIDEIGPNSETTTGQIWTFATGRPR